MVGAIEEIKDVSPRNRHIYLVRLLRVQGAYFKALGSFLRLDDPTIAVDDLEWGEESEELRHLCDDLLGDIESMREFVNENLDDKAATNRFLDAYAQEAKRILEITNGGSRL